MKSVIDVIASLSNLIQDTYPEYKLIDYDVDEGFDKPAFFVSVENVSTSFIATDYIQESSDLEITFFAEDRYEGFLNLLDMKNNLMQLFTEPLEIADNFYVTLLDTTSEIYKADKVLTFSFTANIVNKVERNETDDYMENLYYKEEVHN